MLPAATQASVPVCLHEKLREVFQVSIHVVHHDVLPHSFGSHRRGLISGSLGDAPRHGPPSRRICAILLFCPVCTNDE